MSSGVEAAVTYEFVLLRISQFSNKAVEGPKIKSVVPQCSNLRNKGVYLRHLYKWYPDFPANGS